MKYFTGTFYQAKTSYYRRVRICCEFLMKVYFTKFQSYTDPFNVRNCYLVGLNDLDGSQSHVQDVQAAYLNDLIEIGVTGMYEN